MSDDGFHVVMDAATKVSATRSIIESTNIAAGIPLELSGEPLSKMCRRAQDVLAPLAYPKLSSGTRADPGARSRASA